MAFDAVPGGDPRGRICPRCNRPVMAGQPSTNMYFRDDPDGLRGFTGPWHGACAQPLWDKITPVLRKLGGGLAG